MADAYTSSLRVLEPEPGTSTNTWGARLNAQTFELLDESVAGMTSFTLSGPKTLTTANGATDEARRMFLNVTGGTGGTVTIPAVSKTYLVRNAATGNVVVTTGSGRTATVATANIVTLVCDGTNVDRGADQADIDACLVAAKAYTDAAAFESASGNLPGQSGNAGRFLTTDGTTPSWAPLGTSAAYNTGTSGAAVPLLNASVAWSGTITATGFVGPLSGNASTATLAATATVANGVSAGAVTGAGLAAGAAVTNIGYTPVNRAGDTLTGDLFRSTNYGITVDGSGNAVFLMGTGNAIRFLFSSNRFEFIIGGTLVGYVTTTGGFTNAV